MSTPTADLRRTGAKTSSHGKLLIEVVAPRAAIGSELGTHTNKSEKYPVKYLMNSYGSIRTNSSMLDSSRLYVVLNRRQRCLSWPLEVDHNDLDDDVSFL
jgi:hypothetical protein